MLTTKNINEIIRKEIDELSDKEKKKLLRYIESLKIKEHGETIEILNRTAGAWKNLIDSEKLKKDIYADRLLSTRSGVSF